MANIIDLIFSADIKDLDKAKESLADLKATLPTVGQAIDSLVKSFADIPGAVGLAAVGIGLVGKAAEEMVSSTLEMIETLKQLSDQTQIDIDTLQDLQLAMVMGGGKADQMGTAMNKLNKMIAEAQDPTSKAALQLHQLGISQQEIATGDTAQIFQDIATKLNTYADGANKAALETVLFGRAGPAMNTAIKSMSENLDEATQALIDHGKVTHDDVVSQEELHGAVALAGTVFTGLGLSLTRAVIPALITIVQSFNDSAKEGGVLNDVIKALTGTWDFLVAGMKIVLISVNALIEAFKTLGQGISASIGAWAKILKGDFSGAVDVLKTFGQAIVSNAKEVVAFGTALETTTSHFIGAGAAIRTFENQLKAPMPVEPLNALQKLIQQLNLDSKDAATLYAAAVQGTIAYKNALADVAAAKVYQKALDDGASIELAKKLADESRATTVTNQNTQGELAAQKAINDLIAKSSELISANTETAKVNAAIKAGAYAGATAAHIEELRNDAATADANARDLVVLKEKLTLSSQLASQTTAFQEQLNTITLSTKEATLQNAQLGIQLQYQKDVDAALIKYKGDYDAAAADIKTLTDQLIEKMKGLQTQTKAVDDATKDWQASIKKGLEDWSDAALNVQAQMKSFTANTMDSMTDMVVTFVNTGKLNFKAFAVAVLEDLEKIIVKMLLADALKAAMGDGFVSNTGVTPASGTGGSFAAGGAFAGGMKFFGTGDIVSSPTNFSIGQMGEAGPEAIMPLTRASNGQLGVQAIGSGNGGGNTVVVQTPITINFHGDAGNPSDQAKLQTNLQSQVRTTVLQVLRDQSRSGGLLNPTNVSA
jgi:lambda family phage tail tape measure protein